MRKLKHSDSTIYLGANFVLDFRIWHFQIDDVLNLFLSPETNLRISCDSYNVVLFKTSLRKPGS